MRRLLARRSKASLENAMVYQVGWGRSRMTEDLLRRSKTSLKPGGLKSPNTRESKNEGDGPTEWILGRIKIGHHGRD
jgi:hypothetical protein